MTVALVELVAELKILRKGRGVFVTRIAERVGPALRAVCDVTEEDDPVRIRRKVIARLESLADGLPADLRLAVLAAFAIRADARLPLYQDRVRWIADRLDRDTRTARRRIDDGIQHLAQLATGSPGCPSRQPQVPAGTVAGWHTTALRVAVALDGQRPEVLAQRRIIADRDDLSELDLAVTLAAPPAPGDLGVDVFTGGTLVDRGMESSDRYTFALALPRALARGQTHDFALRFRLPPGQPMWPYVACVPRQPCGRFELSVRFDRTRTPPPIRLLRDAFQRDLVDPAAGGVPVAVDRAGEIHLSFRDLTPGLAYGARWAS